MVREAGPGRRRPGTTRPGRRVRAVRALLVGVVVLGLLLVVIGALQRRLVYFPDTADPGPVTRQLPDGQDLTLTTEDGLELGAWFVPAASGALPAGVEEGYAVLLAPGNGGNRAGRLGLAQELSDRGLAVLLLDYRGYGGNPGSPSRDGIAQDADAAVAALVDLGYPVDRLVYLGESLGTGVVAELAERHTPAAVVLRSPYPTFADVASAHYPWLPVRLLLRDDYDVLGPLSRTDVPVTVVAGSADTIVPPDLSRQVAQEVRTLADEVVLEGVGHNDPEMFGAPVADAVARAVVADTSGG